MTPRALTLLFAATICLGAALLFCVQPMVAKLLAPLLGSTPAVWNTCMLFFQAALLAGYAYAHAVSRLGAWTQFALHFALLATAFFFLPPQLRSDSLPPVENTPVFWLLGTLAATVGLPFFILASTSPLLQRWFTRADGGDPYFLYSASNLGSLAALLGYPALMEPALRLREQAGAWTAGYALLIVLTAACALVARKRSAGLQPGKSKQSDWQRAVPEAGAPLTASRRATWVLRAFIPSSLMLGVTTHLTTDIASIPLLWVVPLALYLTTFILVFARREVIPLRHANRLLPFGAMGLVLALCSEAGEPVWMILLLHLATFFLAAFVCHARLAADRPPPEQLTEFYLWLSVGGVLGGVFNALLAPLLFNGIVEYPLALVLACLARPTPELKHPKPARPHLDLPLALACGALAALLALAVNRLDLLPARFGNALVFGPPAVFALTFMHQPRRFAFAVAAIFLAATLHVGAHGRALFAERNFYGVTRVTLDATKTFHQVIHGSTVHGRQFIAAERRCEPLAYYHRTGPLGDVFAEFNARPPAPVGVVGLGAGAMACYAQPGQEWTFYEIDPAVIRLARGTNYFTYLAGCSREPVRIVAGDARLQLRHAPPAHYGLLVLDAFSSDSIPQHLLTREVFELYLAKLAPGGLLALHISNRYLDLEPVVAAAAAELHLVCRSAYDMEDDAANGKEESHWLLLARDERDLGKLQRASRWAPAAPRPGLRVWTDDYSNILGVFEWR